MSAMHPLARKCLIWGIVLIVVAAAASSFWGQMDYLGIIDKPLAYLVGLIGTTVIMIVREAFFPVGAVLIGAAILINVLAPEVVESTGQDTDEDAAVPKD